MKQLLPNLRHLLLFLLSLAGCQAVNAQELSSPHGLYRRIQQAHSSGIAFTQDSLFTSVANGKKMPSLLRQETLLRPIPDAVARLYRGAPEAISITLRTDAGKAYTLDLLRSQPIGSRLQHWHH